MASNSNTSKTKAPISLKDYVTTEKLGAGSYGEVFKARGKTGARNVVAVKCVPRPRLSKAEQDNLITEIKLLKTLKHKHIVDLVDFVWDSNYIYIITEFCGGGDLSRLIKANVTLPESTCQRFLQQLALALQFIRKKDVAHMDLKPSNILLTSKRASTAVLKLADFGFAQYLKSDQVKREVRGSLLYMAPEMYLKRKYDAKVDLWSVGVILFECLYGHAPYKSSTMDELIAKIQEDKPIVIPRGKGIGNDCHDLLSQCLRRDPNKRIDYDPFFAHPFLDLEHLPAEDSHSKGMALVKQAVEKDQKNDLKGALTLYKRGLEYLVPLVASEADKAKRERLRDSVGTYIRRAEQIKTKLSPPELPQPSSGHKDEASGDVEEVKVTKRVTEMSLESRPGSRPNSRPSSRPGSACTLKKMSRVVNIGDRTSVEVDRFEELLKMSAGTEKMKTGLDIARTGEAYEAEARYQPALEKYEMALGVLIPVLNAEPNGERKVRLGQEVTRWLNRAEVIKEVITIQEKVLQESMAKCEDKDIDKNCRTQ